MGLNPQNPLLGGMINYNLNSQSQNITPQDFEYVQQVRQTGSYIPNPNQNFQQSDPYTDFTNEFSGCSVVVRDKIMQDPDFNMAMKECDRQMQLMVENYVRPQVLQTKDGRIAFERLLAVFREIKDKYAREEAANMDRFQRLMNDSKIQQRIIELENGEQNITNVKGDVNDKR